MASFLNRLIIENFGPIKKATIEVKDMMVFIGPQASGKSTLAKLITILDDINFKQNKTISLKEELEKYNIHSFLKKTSYIEYHTASFSFKYQNAKEFKFDIHDIANKIGPDSFDKKSTFKVNTFQLIIDVTDYMLTGIRLDDKNNILIREIQKNPSYGLNTKLESIVLEVNETDLAKSIMLLFEKNVDDIHEWINLLEIVKQVFSLIHPLDSLYIPAERTMLPLLVANIGGLISNDILIPKNILVAVQQFEKALQQINSIDLDIIGDLRYKNAGGVSYIYHNTNQKTLLSDSSSGIQSFLPILLLVEGSLKSENFINLNYVVEEPELNLYPEAQYNLVKYLVNRCLETTREIQTKNLIITTHSPYILSSINNLLLAYSKGRILKDSVKEIINEESWINPEHFNAYEVKNGTVKKIFSKKLGLIEDNMIDEVSEIIMEDFKVLAQIR